MSDIAIDSSAAAAIGIYSLVHLIRTLGVASVQFLRMRALMGLQLDCLPSSSVRSPHNGWDCKMKSETIGYSISSISR